MKGSEYRLNPSTVPARRPHTRARLGPVRWTPGSTEWQAAHCPKTAAPRLGLPSSGCPATGETGPSDELARRAGRTTQAILIAFSPLGATALPGAGGYSLEG